MAKEKRIFKEDFDVGEAISVPWSLPGGKNFLLRLVLCGTALILGVYAVFGRHFIESYAQLIKSSLLLQNSSSPGDKEEAMALLAQTGGFLSQMLLVLIFILLVMAALETALHKNGFHGRDEGAFPLRFAKDELRVLIAKLIVSVSVFGVYILGVMALSIFITILAVAGSSAGGLVALLAVLMFAGVIGFVAVLIRCAISWAPAAAMSVRDGRQYFYSGWAIVQGRSWPLFGSYLVVFLIGYIASYIVMIIGGYIAFGNVDFLTMMMANPDEIDAVFSQMGEAIKQPRVFVPLVIFTIIHTACIVLWYLHIYGVGHYVARLDAKENGRL